MPVVGPELSVVVPTLDRAQVWRAVGSVLDSADHAGVAVEVLVCWQAPHPPPPSGDPRVRVIRFRPLGLSHARNRGLANSRAPVVGFIDDDEVADAGWAANLLRAFQELPEVVGVFGAVLPLDDTGLPYCVVDGTERWVFRRPSTPPWVVGTGGNMAFRREALTGIGGFDPLLGAGAPGLSAEETDVIQRLLHAGQPVAYIPDAVMRHPTKSVAEHLSVRYAYGYGTGAVARRRRDPGMAVRYAAAVAQSWVTGVRGRDRRRRREAARTGRGFLAGWLRPPRASWVPSGLEPPLTPEDNLVTGQVVVQSLTAAPGTALAAWLNRPVHRRSSFPVAIRPPDRIPVDLTGLPTGIGSWWDGPHPAAPEALAVLARRSGCGVVEGRPWPVPGAAAYLRFCYERGRDSVAIARDLPDLVTELQLGSWHEAGWRTRALRRLLSRRGFTAVAARLAGGLPASGIGLAADLAFWAGVRRGADRREWRRLTASYVALCYHRISDDGHPDQHRIEVRPEAFARQLRWARRLGWRALRPEDVLAFHTGAADPVRRGFVVTADDGFEDACRPLQQAGVHAQLFVCPAHVGGSADPAWAAAHPAPGWGVGGEPLADWGLLRQIEAGGVSIGSHAHHHLDLTGHEPQVLAAELADSQAELERRLRSPLPAIAYPHGSYDERVVAAAEKAGYQLGYTTVFGRNGVGTHPLCLRRVPVFRDDSLATFLWKLVTGEPPARRSRASGPDQDPASSSR